MAKPLDSTTENKIKNAARKVFMTKGYAASRTRDIAAESGINLALLNYYFRSKEKLYEIILNESLVRFRSGLHEIINNPKTDLQSKIKLLVRSYTQTLLHEPELALFVITELNNNKKQSIRSIEESTQFSSSVMMKQLQQQLKKKKVNSNFHLHMLTNIYALTVFPFVGKSMLDFMGNLSEKSFKKFVEEREQLIPEWIQQQLITL